jgi:hypothetical protein
LAAAGPGGQETPFVAHRARSLARFFVGDDDSLATTGSLRCSQVGSRNEEMIDYAVVPHCRAGACVVEKVKRAPPPGSAR